MSKRTKKNPEPIEPILDEQPPVAPDSVKPQPNPQAQDEPALEAIDPTETNPSRRRKKKASRKRRRKKNKKANPLRGWAKAAVIAGAVVVTGSLGYGIYNRVTTGSKRLKCGEKYRHLVVTSSGQTLDDSYGYVPTLLDYEEWLTLAKTLVAQAHEHYTELGRVECAASGGTNCEDPETASGGSYPRWNALVPINNRMIGKLDELTSFWNFDMSLSYAPGIQKAQSIIFDALCLMEKADDGIVAYGAAPPYVPTVSVATETERTPAWQWAALGGATALALGGLGYALTRSGGASSPAPHRPSLAPERAHATRPE